MNNKNIFKFISRLLISVGILLINLTLFTALAHFICQKVYQVDMTVFLGSHHPGTPTANEMTAIQVFFSIYSIGTFVFSAFILSLVFKQKPLEYLKLNIFPKPVFLIMIPLLFIAALPILSWMIQWNSSLVLPKFLSGIEQKLKAMEEVYNQLYALLLGMNNYSDLMANIFVMALIPAIGEELFCRGVLLNIFYEFSGKYFWSIFFVALIFTLLHMQFYKVIPMMSLAILLGLFIVWTQSIWASILFHFLNNTLAVLGSFYYQRGVKNLLTDDKSHIPYFLTILSFLLTIAIIIQLNKFSKRNTIKLIHE